MAALNFGSLVYDYQAIDVVGPTDLLNSSSKALAKELAKYIPVENEIFQKAPDFNFHHIGLTLEPVHLLTSNLTIVPTTTVDDCPELDFLLLGGSDPKESLQLPDKYADFIRRHVAAGKVLFSTCTGAAVVAATGVLDGKRATVNNIEYDWLRKNYPRVKWTKDTKWVVDGNIWTASGAVAGMDMFAHWLQENYGLKVLTLGALGLDYEPRDADGMFTVLPKRYDEHGQQIATHHVPKYN
jgi:transcriptional regulator GlxA family with amidase domain